MESVEEVKRKCKEKGSRFGKRYGFELKLRCVKLYLEESVPFSLLSKEVGASTDGIRRWVKAYQERGEAGLQNPVKSLWKRGRSSKASKSFISLLFSNRHRNRRSPYS
jgi:transposase-like protein